MRIYTDNENLKCEIFDIDIVLRWRLILEVNVPYIEYIQGSLKKEFHMHHQYFPLTGIKRLHRSLLIKKIMSEINDTEELPEGIFYQF